MRIIKITVLVIACSFMTLISPICAFSARLAGHKEGYVDTIISLHIIIWYDIFETELRGK